MRAHRARGDRAQVEVSWRRCVASLATLGLEPLDETRAVYQAALSS
jgi:hypothetical protein